MLYNDTEIDIMKLAVQENQRISINNAHIHKIASDFLSDENFNGKLILDIGPGQCDFLDVAREKEAITFGIDSCPAVVKLGTLRGHKMELTDYTHTEWPFKDIVFDGIFCRGSINCYAFADVGGGGGDITLSAFLSSLKKSLNPSGWMLAFPFNLPSKQQHSFESNVRTEIINWSTEIGLRIKELSVDERNRYSVNWLIPTKEVWMKGVRDEG